MTPPPSFHRPALFALALSFPRRSIPTARQSVRGLGAEVDAQRPAPQRCGERDLVLADVEPGAEARVCEIRLDDEFVAWLAAFGIGLGERVRVLRRAPFGGPLHVRTSAGGEFAIDRTVAAAIVVAPHIERVGVDR